MADYKESIYQRTTQRFLVMMENIRVSNRRQKLSKDQFDELMIKLLAEVRDAGPMTEEELRNRVLNCQNAKKSWQGHYSQIRTSYLHLLRDHAALVDEKRQIAEIENSTLRRNTLYRAITTLAVGFCIMAVYWVAHYFCIPMPLMRLPL